MTTSVPPGDVLLMATYRVLAANPDQFNVPEKEKLMEQLEAHRKKIGVPWPISENWLEELR